MDSLQIVHWYFKYIDKSCENKMGLVQSEAMHFRFCNDITHISYNFRNV